MVTPSLGRIRYLGTTTRNRPPTRHLSCPISLWCRFRAKLKRSGWLPIELCKTVFGMFIGDRLACERCSQGDDAFPSIWSRWIDKPAWS